MDMHSLVNVTTQSFHTLPIVLQASLFYWRYLIGILREKLSHGTFFSVFFLVQKGRYRYFNVAIRKLIFQASAV